MAIAGLPLLARNRRTGNRQPSLRAEGRSGRKRAVAGILRHSAIRQIWLDPAGHSATDQSTHSTRHGREGAKGCRELVLVVGWGRRALVLRVRLKSGIDPEQR